MVRKVKQIEIFIDLKEGKQLFLFKIESGHS